MQYSKFWNLGIDNSSQKNKSIKSSEDRTTREQVKLSGRNGMLLAYTPAFLAGAAATFAVIPHQDLRLTLLASALTIHFFKRVLEVTLSLSLELVLFMWNNILL